MTHNAHVTTISVKGQEHRRRDELFVLQQATRAKVRCAVFSLRYNLSYCLKIRQIFIKKKQKKTKVEEEKFKEHKL